MGRHTAPRSGWYRVGFDSLEYLGDKPDTDGFLLSTDGEQVVAYQRSGANLAIPGGPVLPNGVTTVIDHWDTIDWPERQ